MLETVKNAEREPKTKVCLGCAASGCYIINPALSCI